MKGNARIIVFVGVILFALTLVLLNMTVFTVRDISVLNEVESQLIDEQSIILDSGLEIGNNIFVISEKKSTESIELAFPYLKVKGIERVFPNKVVIHVAVRIPLMAIKVKDQELYAVIDSSLKILQIIDPNNSIYLTCTKVEGLEVNNPVCGNFLDSKNIYNSRLATIAYVAENEKLNDVAFLNFFEKIEFIENDNLVFVKLRSGVTICLKDVDESENKFRYALEVYRYFGEQSYKRTCGYIFYDESATVKGWNWSEINPYQKSE